VFGKSTNYLYLLMAVLALSPMGGIAADKPVAKTSAKKPAKAAANET